MPNKPDPKDIVWDESGITWDEPTKPTQKDYLTRVLSDWSKRGSDISKDYNDPITSPFFLDRMLRIGGNVAGAIGDPLAEAATSAYRTVVPQGAQDTISESIKEVANNPQYKPFVEGISKAASEHPEAVKNIEAATNIATLPGVMSAYKTLYNTGKKAVASTTNPLRMYTSAVKPGTKVKKGMADIQDEMQYALDKGMMPNQKGLDIVNETLAGNRAQVKEAMALHPNATITTGDAMKYIPDLIDEWSGINGKSKLPETSKDIIQKAANDFWLQQGGQLSLPSADNIKGNIYRQQKLYKAGSPRPISEIEEFDKQLARGLKDSIYEAVKDTHPDLALLGEDSKLMIDLRNTFEAAAQRIGRRDLMGIGLPIKTGVGSVVGKVTGLDGLGTTVGIIAGVLDVPTVKAKLAIALNKAKQKSLVNNLNKQALEKLSARVASQKMMEDNNE